MTPAGAANFEDFADPHLALSSITLGLPGAPSQKGLDIYNDNRSYPKDFTQTLCTSDRPKGP